MRANALRVVNGGFTPVSYVSREVWLGRDFVWRGNPSCGRPSSATRCSGVWTSRRRDGVHSGGWCSLVQPVQVINPCRFCGAASGAASGSTEKIGGAAIHRPCCRALRVELRPGKITARDGDSSRGCPRGPVPGDGLYER
jgi:hypothetical protein